MKTIILNGNPDSDNPFFDRYLDEVVEALQERGHSASCCVLRCQPISMCKGCFGCWFKTPGECIIKDASAEVLRSIINADFLLLASPVKMGFVSVQLKTMMDKFLPLLHPYARVINGELRHIKRYSRYPDWGILLEKQCDTDEEDIEIITECFRRSTLNFHAHLRFSKLIQEPSKEVVDAIVNL